MALALAQALHSIFHYIEDGFSMANVKAIFYIVEDGM
jgi:hypothetical protein